MTKGQMAITTMTMTMGMVAVFTLAMSTVVTDVSAGTNPDCTSHNYQCICNGASACSHQQLASPQLHCSWGVECNGYGACTDLSVTNAYNSSNCGYSADYFNDFTCKGAASCSKSTWHVTLGRMVCADTGTCSSLQISPSPRQQEPYPRASTLECQGPQSCAASTITSPLKYIQCSGSQSCQGTRFSSGNAPGLEYESITALCPGTGSCSNSRFSFSGATKGGGSMACSGSTSCANLQWVSNVASDRFGDVGMAFNCTGTASCGRASFQNDASRTVLECKNGACKNIKVQFGCHSTVNCQGAGSCAASVFTCPQSCSQSCRLNAEDADLSSASLHGAWNCIDVGGGRCPNSDKS